jgi:toxin-antitoxin system PIN domain toxin
MIIPDANLLLYAADKECADHAKAASWWRKALHGSEEIGLCAVVAFGFIRLATNRKVFRHPLTVKDARARVANWLEFPNVVWIDAQREDLAETERLLQAAGSAGSNLVTDAQIAAIASRTGGSVYSCDHDFGRFPSIEWTNPLE